MGSNSEPREEGIQSAILKWLRNRRIWCDCYHGSPLTKAGIPDILIIKDGRALWLEVKTPSGKLTKIQQHTHFIIRKQAGAPVFVVRSLDEAIVAYHAFTEGIK
jgi:hypothetical protein